MNLTPLVKNDEYLLKLAKWRSHPCVRPVLLTQYVTAPDLDRQRRWADSVINSETEQFFFIMDGIELVGYCGLIKIHMIARTAELSILINPKKKGEGLGSKSVKELCRIGFKEIGLNCIYVDCYTLSKRNEFFEKCGFREDGRLRARKFWDGAWHDSIMLSMLKEEFIG